MAQRPSLASDSANCGSEDGHRHMEKKEDSNAISLWHSLRIARALGLEMLNRELRELGLTRGQATLFFAMRCAGEKATIAELSRWTWQRPHGLSALVGRLEAQGYVKRVHDLERKNQVRVELTEKGRVAYETAKHRQTMNKFIGSLTDEQRQCLGSALGSLIEFAAHELHLKQAPRIPSK
jgi:DNA-binding MarR family transcriptional regulator